ncbi:hypothetical protein V5O48_004778 [Marasmius crinis-equi]|uniref:Uncharacterized protein n=1 Tax=Marasmius crinis-equi TaxID=585013 RepID=A0ABR3FP86_9AGAR
MNSTTGNQPEGTTPPLLVTRLEIENLGSDYDLTEDQINSLCKMSFVASNSAESGEITRPQLAVTLMSTAMNFNCWNRRYEDDQNLRQMVSEMELLLHERSTLTRPMDRTLRSEARVVLYHPARTNYCNLGEDIYGHIAVDPEKFGFTEFFETPAKAASFRSRCAAMAREVRNAMKKVVNDSLASGAVQPADCTIWRSSTRCCTTTH